MKKAKLVDEERQQPPAQAEVGNADAAAVEGLATEAGGGEAERWSKSHGWWDNWQHASDWGWNAGWGGYRDYEKRQWQDWGDYRRGYSNDSWTSNKEAEVDLVTPESKINRANSLDSELNDGFQRLSTLERANSHELAVVYGKALEGSFQEATTPKKTVETATPSTSPGPSSSSKCSSPEHRMEQSPPQVAAVAELQPDQSNRGEAPQNAEATGPQPGQSNAAEAVKNAEATGPQPGQSNTGEAVKNAEATGPQPDPSNTGEAVKNAEATGPQPDPSNRGEADKNAEATGPQPEQSNRGEAPKNAEATGPQPGQSNTAEAVKNAEATGPQPGQSNRGEAVKAEATGPQSKQSNTGEAVKNAEATGPQPDQSNATEPSAKRPQSDHGNEGPNKKPATGPQPEQSNTAKAVKNAEATGPQKAESSTGEAQQNAEATGPQDCPGEEEEAAKKAEELRKRKLAAHARYMRYFRSVHGQELTLCMLRCLQTC